MGLFSFLQPVEHAAGAAAHAGFSFLNKQVVKPAVNEVVTGAKNFVDSPIVQGGRVAAATVTNNPVALANAKAGLKKANKDVAATLPASKNLVTRDKTGKVTINQPEAQKVFNLSSGFAEAKGLDEEPAATPDAAVAADQAAIKPATPEPLSFLDKAKTPAPTTPLAAPRPAASIPQGEPVAAVAKRVNPNRDTTKATADQLKTLIKAKTPEEATATVDDLVPEHKVAETAAAVAQTKDPHIIRNLIKTANSINPPHIQSFVDDYAEELQHMEASGGGGDMVPTDEGGFKRVSPHSTFYRETYKATGRAPTKNDWQDEAQYQLDHGKAETYAQQEYNKLQNPDVGSLLNQPASYFEPDTSIGEISRPDIPAQPVPVPPNSAPVGAEPPGNIPKAAPAIEAPRVPGESNRGFLTRSQRNENLTPETRQALADVKPQTFKPNSNPALIAKTKQLADSDRSEAYKRVFEGATTPAKYDENVALGGHLIQQAQKEGNISEAVRIAERLDINGRELGRGVQAYAAIHRLSPEGILLYAQRQIRKAREAKKDFTNETPTASDIKKQVEEFKPEDKPVVQKAIKETVNNVTDAVEEQASTGERLAKAVGHAASPAKAKKTDELVKELTKKVKQEYLEPRTNVAKPPLQILQEVFGRVREAKEAYPEAQQILRDKYADNEEMSSALDKFFSSKLGDIPAANTTIDRTIADQLKTNKISVMKAIYKSYAEQHQTVEDITRAITETGFDEHSAGVLAKEITERLNKQFGEAKARALDRLSAEAPERAKPTYIDKVNKLSNVGALDKADYIDLARAKLNLPNLKPEVAQKLSEMSQHLQTLPEGAEKYKAIRQLKQLIEENTPLTGKHRLAQLAGTPRALLASGDLSFGGRQAIAYATSHPLSFARQFVKQFSFFKQGFQGDDSEAFDNLMGQIQSHKDYKLLKESPLAITDPFGISPDAREEQFIGSHYAEKIPVLGRLVRGSDYAFTGLGNSLRANEFYSQIEQARNAGLEITPKLRDDIAEVINTATGRGNAKFLENHMKSLSTALFAPRLILSRVQMFNPHYYLKLDPFARKEAIRNAVSLTGFAIGLLTAAKAAGAQVGLNPNSSDFGKIKVGNTRLDFFGGYTQYIRLVSQLTSGTTISSLSGRSAQVGTGFGQKSRKDIVSKFLENKENPIFSFGTTLLTGSDAVGNPVNPASPKDVSKQVLNRFIPLVFQDVADMVTHKNSLNPLVGAPLALVGVGTQTYGKQDIQLNATQQGVLKQLQKAGAPPAQVAAYKDFYQTLKTTPDRQNASDQVNAALQTQDFAKAQKIAADYNKQYAESFKEWATNHGQYEDSALRKEYNSNKIQLTSADIRTRLRNIRAKSLATAVLGGK